MSSPGGGPTADTTRTLTDVLARHLPFLIDTYRTIPQTGGSPYEPGLLDANAAVAFALSARRAAECDSFDRSPDAIRELALEALRSVSRCRPEEVPPLAWSYASYAHLLAGDRCDEETRSALVEGVVASADRLLEYVFPTGLYRDTKAEETCWTAGPLIGAVALASDHPHVSAWGEQAHRFFLNSYNREADLVSGETVCGKRVSERVTTANLFDDFTCENHGAFHPSYQACINNYAVPYLIYRDVIGAVPASLTWNWRGIHDVMSRLIRANGRIVAPAGTDYFPYSHAEQIHYFALVADALEDRLAYRAAYLAARRIEAFQATQKGRLVGDYLGDDRHIYWEYHFASFVALAGEILAGGASSPVRLPVPEPTDRAPVTDRELLDIGDGPWSSLYCRFVVHKDRAFHASFSLRSMLGRRPGSGYVVPETGPIWTDHFCTQPSLSPVILDSAGLEVELALVDHRVGHDRRGCWAVGAFTDDREHLRRTCGFYAGADFVLHAERIMRYGEQVRIFGSDTDLSHSRAEGTEFGSWRVTMLNYRVVRDELDPDDLTVDTAERRRTLGDRPTDWSSRCDRVVIGGRSGTGGSVRRRSCRR